MIGYGNSVFLRTAWEVSGGVPPVNTVAPAITGTAQEGQTVSCSTGTWTGTPTITFAYQWKRNGSNIGSATNSTYTLVTADVSQSITCQVTATNAVGSANATSNTITPTAALDPDAQAFITAAAITNPTQQGAINTLVLALKGYSIWTKFKAIYPVVGGIASSHAVNLKTPGTYNLTFATGVTHSSTGMNGNGSSGYADTFFSLGTTYKNSNHISAYVRSNIDELANEMGAATAINVSVISIGTRYSNTAYFGNQINNSSISFSNTDSRGFWINSRQSSSLFRALKNGSVVGTDTNTVGDTISFDISLMARNTAGSRIFYSTRQLAFASIGNGLTDTEAANFYTAVQAYQTTLSRQV